MIRRVLAAACIAIAGFAVAADNLSPTRSPAGTLAENIHGIRPSYGPARVAMVPNEKAIVRRLWVPELDDGYNPQGLALVDGAVLVSGYRSQAYGVNRGPCRVFRVDAESGRATGRIEVPAPCGHAGGLAVGDGGTLYVADTHALFEFLPGQAFAGPVLPPRGLALGAGVIGGLATATPGAVWLGTYREDGTGRLYRFGNEALSGGSLTPADASAEAAIPSYAQGAAFAPDGRLWVARSAGSWGELARLDPATGAVERRYATAPGIEGIAFGRDGLLWAVSESGARHVYDNFFAALVTPFFPLVFAIDVAKLE